MNNSFSRRLQFRYRPRVDASYEIDTACLLSRQVRRSERVPIGGSFEATEKPDVFGLLPPWPSWLASEAVSDGPVLHTASSHAVGFRVRLAAATIVPVVSPDRRLCRVCEFRARGRLL